MTLIDDILRDIDEAEAKLEQLQLELVFAIHIANNKAPDPDLERVNRDCTPVVGALYDGY